MSGAHRRTARVRLQMAAILVGGLLLSPAPALRAQDGGGRPNFVVITVDDMRSDEMQYLPKTLSLLQGTRFTNSYVSTSLCCPSRAAFLSGQYTQNNHVLDNSSYFKFNHANTLATWLQSQGYFTSLVGKYLNGYACLSKIPLGWDHWQALCSNIYGMYGYSMKDGDRRLVYGSSDADYQTDVLASRAVATIDEGIASGKPFFIWLTPTAPHRGIGRRVASRYTNAFSTWTLPPSPSYNETDVSDKPAWVRVLPSITPWQKSTITKMERTRLEMLLAVDDLVEKVVQEIAAAGLHDDTVIIFTSDNGFMLGEHRVRLTKEVEFEESLEVPLIFMGPGFPSGTNGALVMNTDLAPTIAALAAITPGRVFDGRSLLPAADGSQDWSRRAIRHFVNEDADEGSATVPHPPADGVRAGRFSYFELITGERELYDHLIDPYELTNLDGQPAYSALQSQLASMLATLRTCSGDTCQMDLGNIAPTAAATAACTGLDCSFDATGSGDLDDAIVSYDWTFGDGTTASGLQTTHSYAQAGPFAVALTVTDGHGATGTASSTVTPTPSAVRRAAPFAGR